MLTIVVPGVEHFNDDTQEFVTQGDFELRLEHSLFSLSKWESIFEKAFLAHGEKSSEEVLGYLKAMTLNDEVPEEVYSRLSQENLEQVNAYIEKKHSATKFYEPPAGSVPRGGETITAELIYYWMATYQLPLEYEHWHLNRLFTLIKVCNVKNSKPKKMGQAELAARNRQLNEERKAKYKTTG